jgi:O-antigen/teichoic acid export membrane protein
MSRATKHSLILIMAYLANSGLNYLFGVLLSWFLTPEQFGVLGVTQSLLLLTALVAGSGFAWTATHDVATGDVTDATRSRFRAAWTANVGLGLLMGLGLWICYRSGLLPLGSAYAFVVPLVSVTVVLLAARSVINGVARGLYRFGAVGANLIGEVLVKILVGLGLVAVGFGVVGVMAGFVFGAAASLVHSWWIVRPARMWRGKGWFDRRVVVVTLPLFASLLGTALMLNLDVLGLKLLSPAGLADELSGFYQAAVILARTPVYLAQALTLVLFSYVAGARRQPGPAKRRVGQYLGTVTRSWVKFLLPAGLILFLAPRTALLLFFPVHYQAAASALQLAAAGGALLALVNMVNGVLQASGERGRPAAVTAAATAAQIVVLYWLVPRLGVLGAAVSLLTAGVTALIGLALICWPYLASSFRGRSFADVAFQLLRFALPPSWMLMLLLLVPDGDRALAFIKLGLAGLAYLAGVVVVEMPALDRQRSMPEQVLQLMQVVIGG